MPFINCSWQPIPGTKDGWIYPIMKKPDITSSNAWIIRSAGQLIIIDTGSEEKQLQRIEDILSHSYVDGNTPVLLLTSHAHIDHIYQGLIAHRCSRYRYILCAQEYGACAIETGDQVITAADLIHLKFQKEPVDIHLLTEKDRHFGGTRTIQIPGSPDMHITTRIRTTASGISIISQQVQYGTAEPFEVWYTPGHSRDSVSVTYGDFIHLGDIPFATNPAVAGLPGWEPAELVSTMARLDWIIANQHVSIIGSGHGNAQQYNMMQPQLNRIAEELNALPPIILINTTHIEKTVQYALDLIDEAHRIFPVIAGRIMVLCYYLEELGEDSAASRIASVFEGDTIDEFLTAFTSFYDAYRNGEKIEYQVLMKALTILEKIEKNFPSETLVQIIDPSILRRASRLFKDFLDAIYGLPPKRTLSNLDPYAILTSVLDAQQIPDLSYEDLFSAVEEPDLFSIALAHRIAHKIQARTVKTEITFPVGNVEIIADTNRFSDFFSALLLQYDAGKIKKLTIGIFRKGAVVTITLQPELDSVVKNRGIIIPGALIREVRSAGGWIESPYDPETGEIIIAFPAAEE
jgi:glyoxylase-like metal-dependent hydrolase (beta-lactamase superfamily II)